MTRAFVSVHDTIAPRYRAYLEADPALDPATRANLLVTVDEWTALVESVRADVSIPGAR